jgi:hypothetical protein
LRRNALFVHHRPIEAAGHAAAKDQRKHIQRGLIGMPGGHTQVAAGELDDLALALYFNLAAITSPIMLASLNL